MNPTTVTELIGIKIADTSGVRWPDTANDKPIILYANDKAKAANTIPLICLAKLRIFGTPNNLSEDKIASQAGEN